MVIFLEPFLSVEREGAEVGIPDSLFVVAKT